MATMGTPTLPRRHSGDRVTAPIPRGRAAVAGLLAAALALAVSSLLAGIVAAAPSLVVSVGDWVVDNVPPAIEQWAIATLGTADKPALIAGILLLSGAFGALLGLVAVRRFAVAAAGFAAFGAVGWWTAAADAPVWGAVSAATSAAAGVAALWWLLSRARAAGPGDRAGAQEGAEDAGTAEPIGTRATRRAFLSAAAITATAVVVSAGAGRMLLQSRNVAASRADVRLPEPARAAPEPDAGVSVDVEGVHPWVTPNDEFYRIDTALRIPQVDPATWRLAFTGMVDRPYELTYDDLLGMPLEEHFVTIACVSNEVGGELVDNARWLGVRLDRLLATAGVQSGATQVVGRSVDGFTVGFPTEVARDGRAALVAVGMNGEPLPAKHGFPARLVVPGLFGYVSATKWLTEIELTTLEDFDAYWVPRGWAKFGPIVTQSQIQVPRSGDTVPAGTTPVAGLAWAPARGIARVEVQVDEGPWQKAELADAYHEDTWRQWRFGWVAEPGRHTLRVRATDGTGELQTAEVSPPAPDGATGLHTVRVSVA